jgi:hypothetical protein
LLAIVSGDDLKLISRNGHDRTHLFREPFRGLAGLPPLCLTARSRSPTSGASLISTC